MKQMKSFEITQIKSHQVAHTSSTLELRSASLHFGDHSGAVQLATSCRAQINHGPLVMRDTLLTRMAAVALVLVCLFRFRLRTWFRRLPDRSLLVACYVG